MGALQVVIRGRVEREEFRAPFRQCTEMLEPFGTSCRVNPMNTDEPTDFALFFQSYPHEFLTADLVQLRRNNPFAPFFFVLGACCEGMLRTAAPLDSPFYRYVHGWNDEETGQIRRFLTDQPSIFDLPSTAGNDEIALWHSKEPTTVSPELQKCLILTHFGPFGNDSAMIHLLADEYAQFGYEPLFLGRTLPDSFTGTILADVDDSPLEKILETIQRLRHQFADNDFAVYVDSPRIDEKNAYIKAGATRILSKIR